VEGGGHAVNAVAGRDPWMVLSRRSVPQGPEQQGGLAVETVVEDGDLERDQQTEDLFDRLPFLGIVPSAVLLAAEARAELVQLNLDRARGELPVVAVSVVPEQAVHLHSQRAAPWKQAPERLVRIGEADQPFRPVTALRRLTLERMSPPERLDLRRCCSLDRGTPLGAGSSFPWQGSVPPARAGLAAGFPCEERPRGAGTAGRGVLPDRASRSVGDASPQRRARGTPSTRARERGRLRCSGPHQPSDRMGWRHRSPPAGREHRRFAADDPEEQAMPGAASGGP
jgi:hypothetical protein